MRCVGVIRLSNDPEWVLPIVQEVLNRVDGWCSQQDVLAMKVGLVEIIMNAIEHGNLAIGYASKRRALADGSFEELLEQRQRQEPYASRKVTVEYVCEAVQALFIVRDEGDGFNWRRVIDTYDRRNPLIPNGRGVLIAREHLDACVFNQRGNEVVLVKCFTSSTQRQQRGVAHGVIGSFRGSGDCSCVNGIDQLFVTQNITDGY